jgi:hypothetical protein
MRSNFGVYEIFVDLFIFESDSPVYSPPGSRSEGLERRKLFITGLLPMGKNNHPWLIFLMIVPL